MANVLSNSVFAFMKKASGDIVVEDLSRKSFTLSNCFLRKSNGYDDDGVKADGYDWVLFREFDFNPNIAVMFSIASTNPNKIGNYFSLWTDETKCMRGYSEFITVDVSGTEATTRQRAPIKVIDNKLYLGLTPAATIESGGTFSIAFLADHYLIVS